MNTCQEKMAPPRRSAAPAAPPRLLLALIGGGALLLLSTARVLPSSGTLAPRSSLHDSLVVAHTSPEASSHTPSPPAPAPAAAHASSAAPRSKASVSKAPRSKARCCSLDERPPLGVTLQRPVAMGRPIRVLMRHGNFDGPWPCDVPCEFATSVDGRKKPEVDVVVGEGGPPTIPAELKRSNPQLLTAARSMECAKYYPALRQLPKQVQGSLISTLVRLASCLTLLSSTTVTGGLPDDHRPPDVAGAGGVPLALIDC